MSSGETGPQSRDNVGASELMRHYDVGVAFGDDRGSGGDDFMPGLFEPVKRVTFVKEHRRRRIHILGAVSIQRPAAKTYHSAGHVGNSEHQAVDKLVPILTDEKAGLLEQLERRFLRYRRPCQIVRRIGSQANLPFFHALGVHLPLGDIITDIFALIGIFEILPEVLGSPGVGLRQPVRIDIFGRLTLRFLTFYFLLLCLLPSLEPYPRPFGQSLYHLRKSEILPHLHEFEYIPAGPAGEALEYLLDVIDVHTRAMVSVKGAQTHHFTSLLLQTHMLANDFNDIVGLLNLQDNRIIKHPCHKTQVPSSENAKIKNQESKLRNPGKPG